MPQINGTGLEDKGPKTSRGLGLCKKDLKKDDLAKLGKGLGKRRKSGGGSGLGKRLQSGSKK